MRKVTQKPLLIGGESVTPDALSVDHLGHIIRDPLFFFHTSPSLILFVCSPVIDLLEAKKNQDMQYSEYGTLLYLA